MQRDGQSDQGRLDPAYKGCAVWYKQVLDLTPHTDRDTVSTGKKRRAGVFGYRMCRLRYAHFRPDISTATDKRLKINDGFIRFDNRELSRCPCCNWPDLRHNTEHGRPEYWHAGQHTWCFPEDFSGTTPEELGAPPPIAQSFVFFRHLAARYHTAKSLSQPHASPQYLHRFYDGSHRSASARPCC